jgi:hypothetical protein
LIEVFYNLQTQIRQDLKGETLDQMSNATDARRSGNRNRKLFQGMKEGKSIGGTDTTQMRIHRGLRVQSRIQMSNSKDARNNRNMIWRLFQLMKECRLLEVMNTFRKQMHQDSQYHGMRSSFECEAQQTPALTETTIGNIFN